MARTNLSSVVSRQIPEFIREDFPTFVAFVEAYYEFLQTQGVDLSSVKDLDKTLDSFVGEFKKELAHNLPSIAGDERFLLAHIKDQYLAKGSKSSYNLLFRLLFGKKVELSYPGTQIFRPSDGKWNQDISVFAHVDYGNPLTIVGKLVDIQTETRLIKVLVDKKEDLVGEIDRIVALGGDIYEFFLDKSFFGVLKPGDTIKYEDTFQATILKATQTPIISQPGKNFRVGQVFEIKSGAGTGALLKVTAVDDNNGIKYAEFIKFGLGYNSDFAVSIIASNTFTAGVQIDAVASTSRTGSPLALGGDGNIVQTIGDVIGGFEEQGYINTEDYVVSNVIISATGTIGSITGSGPFTATITGMSSTTGLSSGLPITAITGTGTLFGATPTSCVVDSIVSGTSITYTVTGGTTPTAGTITNLTALSAYVTGGYVGSLLREFSQNSSNSNVNFDDPAIIEVKTGALVRYPGYYSTNDGFLDDSIFIQDSKYYQAFSYVIKLDERLSSYKSAVKTMLHPAGLALFSEFSITNNIDLSIELESLVKSLGLELEDDFTLLDVNTTYLSVEKVLSTTSNPTNDLDITLFTTKDLSSPPLPPQTFIVNKEFTKALNTVYGDGIGEGMFDEGLFQITFGKLLNTPYPGMVDNGVIARTFGKRISTPINMIDNESFAKTLNRYADTSILAPQNHTGYLQKNSYYEEDYIVFADTYSVGSRESTFNTL